MNPVFRLVFSVLAGIAVACMVLSLVDTLNAHMFPSTILHPTLAEQQELTRTAPRNEFLLMLGGFLMSSFFGSYTASRIALPKHKRLSGLFIGFFLLLCDIFYMIIMPQPVWFSVCSIIFFIGFSWIGSRLAFPKLS